MQKAKQTFPAAMKGIQSATAAAAAAASESRARADMDARTAGNDPAVRELEQQLQASRTESTELQQDIRTLSQQLAHAQKEVLDARAAAAQPHELQLQLTQAQREKSAAEAEVKELRAMLASVPQMQHMASHARGRADDSPVRMRSLSDDAGSDGTAAHSWHTPHAASGAAPVPSKPAMGLDYARAPPPPTLVEQRQGGGDAGLERWHLSASRATAAADSTGSVGPAHALSTSRGLDTPAHSLRSRESGPSTGYEKYYRPLHSARRPVRPTATSAPTEPVATTRVAGITAMKQPDVVKLEAAARRTVQRAGQGAARAAAAASTAAAPAGYSRGHAANGYVQSGRTDLGTSGTNLTRTSALSASERGAAGAAAVSARVASMLGLPAQ